MAQRYRQNQAPRGTGNVGFAVFVILAIIGCAVLTIAAITVNSQNASVHYIKGSDARVYRYDANATLDPYYFTYVKCEIPGNTFGITLNGQGGLYGREIFTRIMWNSATLASKVNLTVSQLTCVNGSYRIVWGSMKVFTNEFGMFLNANGSWYVGIINTLLEVNVCISWALKNT